MPSGCAVTRVPYRLAIAGEVAWWLNRAWTALMRCRAWRWL